MARVFRPSLCVEVSETKRNLRMVAKKLEQETGIADSESAIKFTIGSTVPPFVGLQVGTSPIVTDIDN